MAKYLVTWGNGDTQTIKHEEDILRNLYNNEPLIIHWNEDDEIMDVFNLSHARHIEKIE